MGDKQKGRVAEPPKLVVTNIDKGDEKYRVEVDEDVVSKIRNAFSKEPIAFFLPGEDGIDDSFTMDKLHEKLPNGGSCKVRFGAKTAHSPNLLLTGSHNVTANSGVFLPNLASYSPRALSFGDSGLDIVSGSQPISYRTPTLDFLASKMLKDRRNVVLIRAPPGTGKTSLAELLRQYLEKGGAKVDLVDLLLVKTSEQFEELVTSIDKTPCSVQHPYFMILDEAQSAYAEPAALSLWRRLKAKSGQPRDTPNVFVVVFAAYGENVPGGIFTFSSWEALVQKFNNGMLREVISKEVMAYLYDDCHRHMGLLDAVCQMLSLYCKSYQGSLTIDMIRSLPKYEECKREVHGMAFTPFGFPFAFGSYLLHAREVEFAEYITCVNTKLGEEGLQLAISPSIAANLFGFVGGHFGFLATAVRNIYEKFKHDAKSSIITDEMLAQYLRSKEFLDNLKRFRARPRVDEMTAAEKAWVVTLLLSKTAPIPLLHSERAAVYSLMQKGILFYSDAPLEQGFTLLADKIEFISPVIALLCFVELLCGGSQTTLPKENLKLGDFLPQVISQMNPRLLCGTYGRGIDGRHLERVWQMEFYRAAMSLLPPSQFVSPEVGGLWGMTTRCDFYVNSSLCWLIELLRDGNLLVEHLQRFGGGGAGDYLRIPHKEYAVVDFYVGRPPANVPIDTHYWCVVFVADFSAARILHPNGEGGVVDTNQPIIGHGDEFVSQQLMKLFGATSI